MKMYSLILKIDFNMKLKKYQMGGNAPEAMPAEQGAPTQAAEGQVGAEEQLAQIAGQLLESLLQQVGDPNAVMMILQTAMQMLQEAAGGQGGQPVFKKGGKLAKKVCKKACGGKPMK